MRPLDRYRERTLLTESDALWAAYYGFAAFLGVLIGLAYENAKENRQEAYLVGDGVEVER